jgi:hypothetical protein
VATLATKLPDPKDGQELKAYKHSCRAFALQLLNHDHDDNKNPNYRVDATYRRLPNDNLGIFCWLIELE